MTKFVAAALIMIATIGAANALPFDDEADAGGRTGSRVGGGCAPWVCGENGTRLTGIRIDGNRSSALAATVTLPSGEIVRLGANERPVDEVYFGGAVCPPFMCNGTQLTGIQADGNRSSALAATVTLSSGEIIRLGAHERPVDDEVSFGGAVCPPFLCNGTQLTGIQVDGNRSSALAAAVTLPSGEIVRLGANAAEQPRLQVADRKGLRDRVRKYDSMLGDGKVTFDEYRQLNRMAPGAARR